MNVLTRPAVVGTCFERTLLARPGRDPDTSTRVIWIQGHHLYCDLRQPASLRFGMQPETLDDVLALAQQDGFAGPLIDRDGHVEWVRSVSFHPLGPLPDAGTLAETDEDTLIESGVFEDYTEHWRRTTRSSDIEEYMREDTVSGVLEVLVRVGDTFGYARGPAAGRDATPLADRIRGAASTSEAMSHLECEISVGTVGDGHWTISASTLPHRIGTVFDPAPVRSCA